MENQIQKQHHDSTELEQITNSQESILKKLIFQIQNKDKSLRTVNHLTAINSNIPILKQVSELYSTPLKVLFCSAITDYIEIYHPGTASTLVAEETIDLIFENYYTLNPIDIQAFINYIKLNKPNVSGHKITPTELIESLQAYIEQRQEAFEQIQHNKKFETLNEPVHDKVKEVLQTIIDKQEEKKRLKVEKINQQVDEKKQYQSVNMEKYKSIRDRLINKEITEDEALNEWNEFLNSNK